MGAAIVAALIQRFVILRQLDYDHRSKSRGGSGIMAIGGPAQSGEIPVGNGTHVQPQYPNLQPQFPEVVNVPPQYGLLFHCNILI